MSSTPEHRASGAGDSSSGRDPRPGRADPDGRVQPGMPGSQAPISQGDSAGGSPNPAADGGTAGQDRGGTAGQDRGDGGTRGPANAGDAPGEPRRRLDPFAVAALVGGLLALVPVAVACGVLGLARTRRGARGTAAAVAGLALAAGWLAAGGAVAAVALTHRTIGQARAETVHTRVFHLRAGDCANVARGGVSGVHVVPCAHPHDAEVFATFQAAGRRWPGAAALRREARRGCASRLGSYLNPQLAGDSFTESYVYPSRGVWSAGVRTVVCEIRSSAGKKLTGSVRAGA